MPMFGNTLLARVLSHRSTATLYKSRTSDFNVAPADQVASSIASAAPLARSAGPVVMAKLVPPGSDLPGGQAIPVQNVRQATSSSPSEPAPIAQPMPVSHETLAPLPGQSFSPPAEIQSQAGLPAQPPPAQVAPPQVTQQPQLTQQPPADQSPPAAKPDQHEPAKPVAPPPDLPPSAMGDSDFSWISDSEWNNLKRVMERNQDLELQRKASEEAIQLSPEEQERLADKERAAAELAQRQELARRGQLPRASVSYISPESAGKPLAAPAIQASPTPKPPAPDSPAPPAPAPESSAPPAPAPESSAPPAPAPESSAPPVPAPESSAPPAPAPESSAPPAPAPESSASPAPATKLSGTKSFTVPAPAPVQSAADPAPIQRTEQTRPVEQPIEQPPSTQDLEAPSAEVQAPPSPRGRTDSGCGPKR